MKLRRAFTLIELLVVIAIIAILAAILFPVFAQAKQAAKKTASLSNNKQIALSGIMYGADYDDYVPVITNWGAVGVNNGAYAYFSNQGCIPWPQLVQPYIKNNELLMDPQAPPPPPTGAGFNPAGNKLFGPHYGLNPYLGQTVSFPYGSTTLHNTRSFTAVSRPADVVFFSQKYSNTETLTNVWYGGWWYGAGTFLITLVTDPPDCYAPGNVYYCASGWTDNTFYGGTGGQKELKNVEAAGAWTGGGSMRGRALMLVTFTDGHAATKSPGALAEGTAYNGAKGANNIPSQNQSAITVTDITREHWLGLQ
jgi:prepilin-type N-terminal cleavage/methylation domain-containing protein